jgi:hypothetical protein
MDTRAATLASVQRQLAEEDLADPRLPFSIVADYRRKRAHAVLATVAWVEGRTTLTPASREHWIADEDVMDRERTWAHDREREALGSPAGEYAGVVEQLLACLLGRAGAQPPYVG